MAESLVIFVEDPGAVNFIADLPRELASRSITATLIAAGPAQEYLARRGDDGFLAADRYDAAAILDRFRPALVVLGTSENPRSLAFALEAECTAHGIPTVGAIDSPAAAEQRFRGETTEPLAHAPDWLLVPEQWTARQYERLGFPTERIVVCGHPHYDYVRSVGRTLAPNHGRVRADMYPSAPPDVPILLFAAELSTGLDPAEYRRSDDYTLHGRGRSVGRTEIVIEEFLDAISVQEPRPYCVLRLHPKNDAAQFARYMSEFQQVSQTEPALEMIVGSDGVVGMTTMLLVEAVLLGKPTLSIVPRELEREWLPTTYFGLTPSVADRAGVRAEVERLVAERPAKALGEVEAVLRPGSLGRVVDAISDLISKPS